MPITVVDPSKLCDSTATITAHPLRCCLEREHVGFHVYLTELAGHVLQFAWASRDSRPRLAWRGHLLIAWERLRYRRCGHQQSGRRCTEARDHRGAHRTSWREYEATTKVTWVVRVAWWPR